MRPVNGGQRVILMRIFQIFVSVVFLASASAAVAGESPRVRDIVVECAQCHGADGVSIRPGVPDLAGKTVKHLLAQLKAFRDGQRPEHAAMRGMRRDLTGAELRAIATHFARLPAP